MLKIQNEIDIDALPDANNHADIQEPEVIPFDNNFGMGTVDIDSLEDIDISICQALR